MTEINISTYRIGFPGNVYDMNPCNQHWTGILNQKYTSLFWLKFSLIFLNIRGIFDKVFVLYYVNWFLVFCGKVEWHANFLFPIQWRHYWKSATHLYVHYIRLAYPLHFSSLVGHENSYSQSIRHLQRSCMFPRFL